MTMAEEAQTLDADLSAIIACLDVCTCFHDLLFYHRQERPDQIALIDEVAEVTYAQLVARAERLAARLVAHGLTPGDRIALLAKNDVAFVDLMMAASMTGLVFVPLNFRLAQPEIDFIVQDSEAKLVFVGTGFLETARAAQANSEGCHR